MIYVMGSNVYKKNTNSLIWLNYGDKMNEFNNKILSKNK